VSKDGGQGTNITFDLKYLQRVLKKAIIYIYVLFFLNILCLYSDRKDPDCIKYQAGTFIGKV